MLADFWKQGCEVDGQMQELEGQIVHRVNEHNTPHYDIAQPLPRLLDVEQGRRMTMFTAKAQENVSRV